MRLYTSGRLWRRILHHGRLGDGECGLGRHNRTLRRSSDHNIPLGCGHDNEGMFGMAAGILGLGLGPLSFSNHVEGGVFSYCLPDRESDRHSSLIFGEDAIPDHAINAVKFTPQLRNPRVATYYYVQVRLDITKLLQE